MKLVDVTTGDIHLVGVVKRPRQRHSFAMVFQDRLAWIVSEGGPDLRTRHFRVLCLLLARSEFENWCAMSVSDIARALRAQRSSTSTVLNELEQFGLVQRHYPRPGFAACFRIDPNFAWRGDARTRDIGLEEARHFEEERRKRG